MNRVLTLSDFKFDVPAPLIAQNPLSSRDNARLFVANGPNWKHQQMNDLPDLLPKETLLILNDSRVISSRVYGHLKTGARIEILFLEPYRQDQTSWLALGKPMKKLKVGSLIEFKGGVIGEILELPSSNSIGASPLKIKLHQLTSNALKWLEDFGEMPLPPYIERRNADAELMDFDRERYQTVYAKDEGSVAAPTAGLHFTPNLMARLKERGIEFQFTTLHVGAGTFQPVKSAHPGDHTMHSERFLVPSSTLKSVTKARKEGRPVVVVGTTALRSLEGLKLHSMQKDEPLENFCDQWLRTDIFIRPEFENSRHKPWCCDGLMTNFHQPESTLFMLVCAIFGFQNMKNLYQEAVDKEYRFFSYGDSSLLWI